MNNMEYKECTILKDSYSGTTQSQVGWCARCNNPIYSGWTEMEGKMFCGIVCSYGYSLDIIYENIQVTTTTTTEWVEQKI